MAKKTVIGAPDFVLKALTKIKPGDILVLESQHALPENSMAHLHAEFKRLVPEVRIIILQSGVSAATAVSNQAVPMLTDAIRPPLPCMPERMLQAWEFDGDLSRLYEWAHEIQRTTWEAAAHAADTTHPRR